MTEGADVAPSSGDVDAPAVRAAAERAQGVLVGYPDGRVDERPRR
jgi:hypothetical protein